MLQSIEEKASNYASSLQTLETEILKDVKKLKACKQQRMKKFFDRVSFLQKEVEGSVSEVRPISKSILIKGLRWAIFMKQNLRFGLGGQNKSS